MKKTFHTSVLIVLAAITSGNASAEGLFDNVEICENIRNITARDTAKGIQAGCSEAGMHIDGKKLRKWVYNRLEPKHLPAKLECLASCAALKAFENTEMRECVVDVHVKPFVEGVVGSMIFNSDSCGDIKSQAN